MKEIQPSIQLSYENAGFMLTSAKSDYLRFQNPFSVHFVFLFDSLSHLAEGWKVAHDKLIEDYLNSSGPKDLEWNYYAVFVLLDTTFGDAELSQVRGEIEGNVAYSRKFLVEAIDFTDLPPGIIHPEEFQSKKLDTSSALQVWDKQLGKELFQLIVQGPKKSLEDRLRNLIFRGKNEK